MTQTLHIITGPTAVGKTEYALSYAEAHHAEIVSCDASLVYRGMDIGTAKPCAGERARVPHHMIDLCEVDEPYNIVEFDRAAHRVVEAIFARGRSVVVTGGSGFYLKSFLSPVIDSVVVPDEVREQVESLYQSGGLAGLLERLRLLSPGGLGNLDTKNPRRVLRALERCIASGKEIEVLQQEFASRPEPYGGYAKHLILLERDSGALKDRAVRRAEAMLAAGLVEEVRQLMGRGIEKNPAAASAIGYRETIGYLRGEIGEDELLPAIIQNTFHLIKKQRTWFRTQIRKPDLKVQL